MPTHLPPDQWGKAAAGWGKQFFAIRVIQCDDPERLRAAVIHEAERDAETRPDRIARLNKQIDKVTQ